MIIILLSVFGIILALVVLIITGMYADKNGNRNPAYNDALIATILSAAIILIFFGMITIDVIRGKRQKQKRVREQAQVNQVNPNANI